MTTSVRVAAVICAIAGLAGQTAAAPRQSESQTRQAIGAAEDARAPTPESVQVLLDAARSGSPVNQAAAVRAIGRLERPALADAIASLLAAPAPQVRAEAANALGQAVTTSPEHAGGAIERLVDRLAAEKDPTVVGAVAETLGRLPCSTAEQFRRVEAALVAASLPSSSGRHAPRFSSAGPAPNAAGLAITWGQFSDSVPLQALVGVVKGLESLIRLRAKIAEPAARTLERLRILAGAALPGRTPGSPPVAGPNGATAGATRNAVAVRRLALAALAAARDSDVATFNAALRDRDVQIRRLALVGLSGIEPADAGTTAAIRKSLSDPSPMVRYEALRVFARQSQGGDCAPMIAAARDKDPHVALQGLDLLGGSCPAKDDLSKLLAAVADELTTAHAPSRAWHRPAHALTALAKIDGERAAARLPAFASHPVWQVRMYAARAATTLEDRATLGRLARDQHANVRDAAVGGLGRVAGHGADDVYLAALDGPDYQLTMTAARALGGTPEREKATAELIAALGRLTADKRDTSRDPRVAMLERLREVGSAGDAAALVPYVSDFDPRVRKLAADLVTAWTGQPPPEVAIHAIAAPAPPIPAPEDLVNLTARVTMRGLGTFEMKLLGDEAPATVARFIRLARAGYYNSLTFHRIVPNFIIQGGSPGANEYAGDGPYMRDEVGLLPHARGSVGISTRGRDTGDAQIFINLVDNPRLDHDYTVFADVTRGMDVIDAVLEGDIIERVEIVGGARPGPLAPSAPSTPTGHRTER
jgi:cyclophilin family peptidyl-prolyl cis-trans isomerase/HEAT repeat protein